MLCKYVKTKSVRWIVKNTLIVPVNLAYVEFVNDRKRVSTWFRHFPVPCEAVGMSYLP